MNDNRNDGNRFRGASNVAIQPLGTVQTERSRDPQPCLKYTNTKINNRTHLHKGMNTKTQKSFLTWGKWVWKRASSRQTPRDSFSPAALWLVSECELRFVCMQPGGWDSTLSWYFKAPLLDKDASIKPHQAQKGRTTGTFLWKVFNVLCFGDSTEVFPKCIINTILWN